MDQNQAIELKNQVESITGELGEQLEKEHVADYFTYALIFIVIASMIFEYLVKIYKEQIRDKKQKEESPKNERIKLWITYSSHIIFCVILWLVCTFALQLPQILVTFLIIVTVFIVWIGTIKIFFRKNKNK